MGLIVLRKFCNTVAIALALITTPALADRYSMDVTRKGSNLYEATASRVMVVTRYCYEYAYYEAAILDWNGYNGALYFLDSNADCDVRHVYAPASVEVGRYDIDVTREEDNWYSVNGTSHILKTSLCLELALSDDAILDWSGVSGTLHFLDGNNEWAPRKMTRLA